MDDKYVSLQVHEGDMTRMERSNKRLFIALIVAVIILLINNIVWIGFENHRQDITNKVLYETEEK
ncbi:hypothetical protein [Butyrivibrio virus Ceridwen]|nr:hypothetical protein [Butyrivibrio virus Ceridwen]